MDNPTFKLEGIVKSKDEMEDFEGPLTLILQLLSKNKIEIKDIQISSLLDQYLAYLDEMKSMDLEVASEFVAMASHLVYIKTRTLLYADEENTELDELISSLENLKSRDTYVRIKAVTDTLQEMFKKGAGLYAKPPEYFRADTEYRYDHDKSDLFDAMRRVLDREEAQKLNLSGRRVIVPTRIVYSVSEKAEEIKKRLNELGVLRVNAFFHESRSRTELVATFIAVLELCKSGSIILSGADDDMIISCSDGETAGVDGNSAER